MCYPCLVLTCMSLARGWEHKTPVQVRSDNWREPTPFVILSVPLLVDSADFDDAAALEDFPPRLAAAAAFLAAAFFLLASDTIFCSHGSRNNSRG